MSPPDPKPLKRTIDHELLAVVRAERQPCVICGARNWAGAHHILSRAQGGDDVRANLASLCVGHHDAVELRLPAACRAFYEYLYREREDTLRYLEGKLGEGGAWDYLRRRYLASGLTSSRISDIE